MIKHLLLPVMKASQTPMWLWMFLTQYILIWGFEWTDYNDILSGRYPEVINQQTKVLVSTASKVICGVYFESH